MSFFKYGRKEIEYLKQKDEKLGEIIDKTGMIERPTTSDLFQALVESIIEQQISKKAAITVNKRLKELVKEVTPEVIGRTNHFDIQKCGTTLKKASYIKIAADAVLNGKLDLKQLPHLSDKEIIEQLVALPGIGIWTAEMLMIFSLQRPDVLSYDDLIIRRGIQKLNPETELTKAEFEKYRKRYSPYCSVASLYLWAYGGENSK